MSVLSTEMKSNPKKSGAAPNGLTRGPPPADISIARMPAALKIPDDPFHHLNPAGYDVIVARLLPAVEALIKRVHERERER